MVFFKVQWEKMSIIKNVVSYAHENVLLEGFVATSSQERRPLVILCHAWKGRDDFIMEAAARIASWGYVGFALDMYGKGILGASKEESAALKKPFLQDRSLLQKRLLQAYDTACALPYVDAGRITVVGFGFGGLCALDLARSGVPLKGAISVYGHFDAPLNVTTTPIKAKVLILHGHDDAIVPLTELSAFEQELNQANVDWQVNIYSHTMHAFMNPSVNDPAFGTVYNPLAAERGWIAIKNFLVEC
ncbi:MAG: carboxymethylenebutenolidase [Chlamydiia bacterium]|nr:carboxymethylenebutenolidase [Chlamydiia bacterium]